MSDSFDSSSKTLPDCYESETTTSAVGFINHQDECQLDSDVGVVDEEWYVSDLQLAAELGKTLLERNQDLEVNLKQQQAIIEEQAQEIQFLSRQSAALKEVNDSRLRIYEQLEVSVTDLEKTNQKLLTESNTDKKRIRRLCDSVDTLELKCEELQKIVDELKSTERLRKRERNRTVVPVIEDIRPVELRRRFSIENGSVLSDCSNEMEVIKLRASVSKLTSQFSREQRRSEELEAQASMMAEENTNLREQVQLLQEQQERLVFFHQAERLYWACHKCKDPHSTVDSPIASEVEPGDEPNVGPCTLVQLKNGAVAYGSQESLASVGVVMENNKELLESKMSQRNCISLLSELDAQYRAVIEKYEDLLHTRRQQAPEYYEDLSLNSMNSMNSVTSTQSCTARSISEEFSEASDLSSGFSDSSEKSFIDQGVQTESKDDPTPVEKENENPVSTHFKGSPEYKKLFQDIFDILKRPAAVSPIPQPPVLDVKEEKPKSEKKRQHYNHERSSPVRYDVKSHRKPFFIVSPQSVIGYPVFQLPGAMTYAEVLEKGSKRGKPLYKQHKP